MPAEPQVVFQAPSAAAAERARELLHQVGIQPAPTPGDPLLIWVTATDYANAAALLDAAFPPEGAPPPPVPVGLHDSRESEGEGEPVSEEPEPDHDPPPTKRRRIPAGIKVATIAGCSAFLPWAGSVFAVFAVVAALWLLTRKRTPVHWIALVLAVSAVTWQAFLFTRVVD